VITDGLMAENPHGDRLTSPSPVLALRVISLPRGNLVVF